MLELLEQFEAFEVLQAHTLLNHFIFLLVDVLEESVGLGEF